MANSPIGSTELHNEVPAIWNADGTLRTPAGVGVAVSPIGPYATPSALEDAYPAASSRGLFAQIGSSAPYTEYVSNGIDWVAIAELRIINGVSVGLIDSAGTTRYFSFGTQSGIPIGLPPSGTIDANGALTLGVKTAQTLTLSGTSGTVTATASGAAFVGTTAGDVGRVITLDNGKQLTITVATSTTICTGTLSATTTGLVFGSNTWLLSWPMFASYPDIYLYFPANSIFAGSAAGFFYTRMSSTTTANIYQDRFLSAANEVPVIPAVPTVHSGTTGADYTQITTLLPVANLTIPATRLGKNGNVISYTQVSRSKDTVTSAHVETFNVQSAYIAGLSGATSSTIYTAAKVQNRGATNKQVTTPNQVSMSFNIQLFPFRYMAHDTNAIDIPYEHKLQLTNPNQWIILESISVEVNPAQ